MKIATMLAPWLLMAGTSALAADSGWRLSEVSGDVRVVANGSAHAAVRGALVEAGALVAAGPRGKAVLVRDKDVVTLTANSRIRLIPPAEQKGFFQIIAEFGTSLFSIEHKANPHFGVRTPYLAAVVKGTVFSVTVDAARASVQVTQGAVDVATLDGGAHDLIKPGMIGWIAAGEALRLHVDGDTSRVVASPAAPPAPTPAAIAGGGTGTVAALPPGLEVKAVSAAPIALAEVTHGLVDGGAARGRDAGVKSDRARSDPSPRSDEHGGSAPAAHDAGADHGAAAAGSDLAGGHGGKGGKDVGKDKPGTGDDPGTGKDGADTGKPTPGGAGSPAEDPSTKDKPGKDDKPAPKDDRPAKDDKPSPKDDKPAKDDGAKGGKK
jgi:hypothetical protein